MCILVQPGFSSVAPDRAMGRRRPDRSPRGARVDLHVRSEAFVRAWRSRTGGRRSMCVAVGAIAGANGSRLIQYGIIGADVLRPALQLIAIHPIVEAFLRPVRVAIAGDYRDRGHAAPVSTELRHVVEHVDPRHRLGLHLRGRGLRRRDRSDGDDPAFARRHRHGPDAGLRGADHGGYRVRAVVATDPRPRRRHRTRRGRRLHPTAARGAGRRPRRPRRVVQPDAGRSCRTRTAAGGVRLLRRSRPRRRGCSRRATTSSPASGSTSP